MKGWFVGLLALGAAGVAASATLLVMGSRRRFKADRYAPHADSTKALFREAARVAGYPESWADEPGLHEILDSESGGWVGRPNYTYNSVYGRRFNDPRNRGAWPRVWGELKRGDITARSSATGLGQLLSRNVARYYPGGVQGIGDPLSEAVGMLRYISAEYNNPRQAWESYELPPCCGSDLHQSRIERGRGDACHDGPHRGHINWVSAGCKTHEGY